MHWTFFLSVSELFVFEKLTPLNILLIDMISIFSTTHEVKKYVNCEVSQ